MTHDAAAAGVGLTGPYIAMAILNAVIALAYLFIAARIVPRIGLPRAPRWVGSAFLVACALTHIDMMVHSLMRSSPMLISPQMFVIHTVQAAVDWAFIVLAVRHTRILIRANAERAEELERSSGFLQAMLESMRDGVVAHDAHGAPAVVNGAARRLRGAEALDTGGAAAAAADGPLQRALRGDVIRDVELEMGPEHDRRTVIVDARPIRGGGSGATLGAVATLHDVTDARRADADLREARGVLESAFTHAPIGMALVSVEPRTVGRFLRVNSALCRLVGRTQADLEASTFQSITHPDDLDADLGLMHRLLRGEIPHYQLEKRYLRPCGEVVWILLDASLVRDGDGRPLYAIAQIQDVSERRELDRMKSEFVALASHELRTPLTAVLGYLQIVNDGEVGELNDQQRLFLGNATQSALRLKDLVADVILVAQADAKRLAIEVGDVELDEVVRYAVEMAGPAADAAGVSLRFEGAPEVEVQGDCMRLSQVVDNLISNAIKFTPAGGRVVVSLRPSNGDALVTVSDTGVGIPRAEQARLFERFFRSEDAGRRAVPGSGLGLAIVKMIVEAHGGTVSLQSTEGRGTTVSVRIPMCVEAGLPVTAG